MGIFCEIRLNPSANGIYEYAPGSIVSGAIKYFLEEDCTFKTIIVSLKGHGWLHFIDLREQRRDDRCRYRNIEDYVHVDHLVYTNEKEKPLRTRLYETPFSFRLPLNVPPSLKLANHTVRYKLWCNIMYYLRIKFESPGLLNLSKKFKKEIIVISGGTQRLKTQPLQYCSNKTLKKLSSLFSSNKGKITIKGTISTSVVRPGDNLKVEFEIRNGSSVEIEGVKIKLIEVNKYIPLGHYDVLEKADIDGAYYKYGAIQAGETMNFPCEIPVPINCVSINHSKMISRDYVIGAIVVLPVPYVNVKLEIPVQVFDKGATQAFNANLTVPEYPSDDPSSYWEAMGEEVKEKFYSELDDKQG